jgi:hypothetical protein
VEQIECCYNYSILADFSDQKLARFNLNEKTNDKCHYFLFWHDNGKGAVMQYKLYRHANMLYPRKYMQGSEYDFEDFGSGVVLSTVPERDPVTKEKFWLTEVKFKNPDGSDFIRTFKNPSSSDAIQIFYPNEGTPLPDLKDFGLAPFDEKFTFEARHALQECINQMMLKCDFSQEEKDDWQQFLSNIPLQLSDIQTQPFMLPTPQLGAYNRHDSRASLQIDNGLRPVDVVTHRNFSTTSRKKALNAVEDLSKLQPLEKGNFVVLQISVTNCPAYAWNFVVAQVIGDVSNLDTTDADTMLELQIYRPSTMNKLDSKFVHWIGDTNKPWKGSFSRGHVKAIVERQVQGKKLNAKSQKLIQQCFL